MRFDLLVEELVKAGLGRPGKDIFIHSMPASVEEGILLRAPLDGIRRDPELPGYYRTSIQAIVRARKVEAGNSKAQAVSDALTMTRRVFEDQDGRLEMLVNHMRPETLPIIYPRSDGNALEWSINFDCCYILP